nr:hypothetical protein [Clavibacter sp. VKM Ac-2873]
MSRTLLIVPRGGMAEEHGAEAIDVDRQVLGHELEELLMSGSELGGAPHRKAVVSETHVDPMRHAQQFSVGVAADQDDAVAEAGEAVEHFRRLRSPRVVPGHDDQLGPLDRGLSEHPVQRGEHAVDVGEDGDGRRCGTVMPREAA